MWLMTPFQDSDSDGENFADEMDAVSDADEDEGAEVGKKRKVRSITF